MIKTAKLNNLLTDPVGQSFAYITLDIDWAPDFVLESVIEMVAKANVYATWFITHNTPLLETLAQNPKFELGIHPNFNFLLTGQRDPLGLTDYKQVIDHYMHLVPNAVSMRSHSLVQGPAIFAHALEKGIQIDSSLFVPASSNSASLTLLQDYSGLKRAPYFWGDYAAFSDPKAVSASKLLQRDGLKIFNFHPIHLYLNSDSIERYSASKSAARNANAYAPLVNDGFGTKQRFEQLVDALEENRNHAN
ncbi:hypothetical protein [Alteromonas flava]|uniref:polysaccharide deacetylase WbmS family protein n=1 Tax=Alteromonas flava TaxID=2048003 RepID=UPI000C289757|nr:hypothetical protein [Alteromonas flava]